jgi:outer membrane protein assembly factor BamB
VAGDVVVAGDDGLVGFDKGTGRPRWNFAPKSGTPGPYLGGSWRDVVFAGSTDGYVYAIDASTGQARWSRRVSDGLVFPELTVESDVVLAGFRDRRDPVRGGVVAIDIATGAERWRHALLPWRAVRAPTGAAQSPSLCNGVVVIAAQDGAIHGFDAESGHVRWVIPPLSTRADRGAISPEDYRPTVCADGALVAGSLTGQIVAYDQRTRRERWRAAPWPSSVAFGLGSDGDSVFVPYLSGHLFALRVSDGTERWRTGDASAGLVWMPFVHDSRLFVAGAGAGFVALRR